MNENSVTWQHSEVIKGSEREVRTHGLRTSDAKMKLTQNQNQALRDIGSGYKGLEMGAGYALLGMKGSSFVSVPGGEMKEDLLDWYKKMIGRLHKWQFETPNNIIYTVEAINQRGYTANTYAQLTGHSTSTIMRWYRAGLDMYADMFYQANSE